GAFLSDLEQAANLTSADTVALAVAVEDARRELAAARRGLGVVGSVTPSAEHERDLATGTGDWDIELELELLGEYRYDRADVLKAEIALSRALERWRDQRRDDLRTALLAMSGARLSDLATIEADLDAAEAQAELAEATTEGATAEELRSLSIEAELAAIEQQRARLERRSVAEALADEGLTEAADAHTTAQALLGETTSAWLAAPPAPLFTFPQSGLPRTPPLGLLALRLALAEHELTLTPFEVLRELELYGAYQASGATAGARLALERGVPTAEATLGWELGEDDHALTFGVGA